MKTVQRQFEDSDTDLIIDEHELSYGEHNNVVENDTHRISDSNPTQSQVSS